MDDLDDLLDEVENKFCQTNIKSGKSTRNKVENERNSAKTSGRSLTKANSKKGSNDFDDLLDELEGSTKKHERLHVPPLVRSLSRTPTPNTTKCYPVFLCGADVATGQGSSLNPLPCDQLRCTDCDFRIVFFDDYQWQDSVDYLFLRNNVPDFNKLKSKLRPKRGCRAYACQCRWKNVKSQIDLNSERDLKWVCSGRH